MLDDFVLRAALAALGVAVAAAPLGCVVVWRRMAYFGDALAHAAILGVALALAFSFSIILGVLAVALIMGWIVGVMTDRGLGIDSGLGVLSHAALAIGLVAVSLVEGVRVDLMVYLFGDILAVHQRDLGVIWGGAGLVVGLMSWRWSAMLTSTVSTDLARAAGIDPRREQLVFTLALAVVVAVAIKVVGALLIGALLLIPASAARALAGTPERMVFTAGFLGGVSALGGVQASLVFDTPAGPSIVCTATVLFLLTQAFSRFARSRAERAAEPQKHR